MPTAARLLLDGPVLPLAVDAVAVAEGVRRAVMSQNQRALHRRKYGTADKPYQEQVRSETLVGKDADGDILRGSHAHAFYLPTTVGRRISQVTVTTAGGIGPDEVAAVAAVCTVRIGFGDKELKVAVQLIGLGTVEQIADDLGRPAAVWESVTPFAGPTHIGQHGRDRFMRKAVRREARRWADELGRAVTFTADPTGIAVTWLATATKELHTAAVRWLAGVLDESHAAGNLAHQKAGEFYQVRESDVLPVGVSRNLIPTEQVPEDRILTLARGG